MAHAGNAAGCPKPVIIRGNTPRNLMLPGMDGFEVCRRIQQERDCFVLMLSARHDEVDRLIGLSVGADLYLTKPFSPREVVARVKAILRRNRAVGQPEAVAASVLRFRGIEIDPDRREVRLERQPVELTAREFDLLYTLAATPGRVFRREHLLDAVWGRSSWAWIAWWTCILGCCAANSTMIPTTQR